MKFQPHYSMFSSFNFVDYTSILFISFLTVFLEKLQEKLVTQFSSFSLLWLFDLQEKSGNLLCKSFFNVNKKRKTCVLFIGLCQRMIYCTSFLKVASANACSHKHMLFLVCIHSKNKGTMSLLCLAVFFKRQIISIVSFFYM